MIQLDSSNYRPALAALDKAPFNTFFARSVLAGHGPARVWADSRDTPQSFYILASYGMSLLLGRDDHPGFNQALVNYFGNYQDRRQTDEWIQAAPGQWAQVLAPLENTGRVKRLTRLNFAFDEDTFIEKGRGLKAEAAVTVAPMPLEMFSRLIGPVVPQDFWRDEQLFSELGYAYTVFYNGEAAATAFSSYRHGDFLEIGIETKEAFRGKGLAELACRALIVCCLEKGLTPVWSCRLENTASYRLAQKLGFRKTLEIPYYHLPLKPA